MTLRDLLEASERGSRELDLEIFLEINPCFRELPRDDRPTSFGWTHPLDGRVYFDTPYTTSIDAAMTLVPEGWRVSSMEEDWLTGKWLIQLSERVSDDLIKVYNDGGQIGWQTRDATANTAPIALAIAALKASSHQEEK
jgi:hypothetical protein